MPLNKKKYKGLSIFQMSLISYLSVGILVMTILGIGFWFHDQDSIKKELISQFSNSLNTSVSFFENTYASKISQDIKFVKRSYNLNAYLSSQPNEVIFTKSLVEELFLSFTNNVHGFYLSLRYIDSKGMEQVITSKNKRIKIYRTIGASDTHGLLNSKIRTLFDELRSSPQESQIFEGPFFYEGKLTFLIGSPVYDPEIGGFVGAIIYHCDLSDFIDHLSTYTFYGKHPVGLYNLEGDPLFISGFPISAVRQFTKLSSPQQLSGVFYQKSDIALMGNPVEPFLQVVFTIPTDILYTRLFEDFSSVLLFLLLIILLIIILSFVIAKQISKPIDHLISSVERFGKGDFFTRTSIKIKGELGVLFDSFNQMADKISQYRDHLEEIVMERTENLRIAKEKADQASKAKSQFLANMSHEIRTPMNAIVGFSYLLQSTNLDDAQKEYVETIKNSSDNLLALINDILDISKIEANSIQLEKIDFDMEYLISSQLKLIKSKAYEKDIDLVFEFTPGTPIFYKGDPTRIRQIIVNLLSNASKFTETGEIKITVDSKEPQSQIGALQEITITIKDTGIGIHSEKLEAIFEIFTQADESTTRKFGGTGLGLSISRALAQKMDGDITVKSQPGIGSEFIVALKLEIAAPINEKDIALVDLGDLKGKKIAIVDDNRSALDLMERYCIDIGLNVIFSNDQGQKLLDWLKVVDELPDIIISDIMMPQMDGLELAKNLRQEPRYDRIKLIAATSDARPGTAGEAQQAGFDAYLPKPIIRTELIKIIQVVLGDKREEKEIITRHTSEEISLKGVRVLLVDDQKTNQQLMKVYMDMYGCVSDYADNGQEAIEKIKNNTYDLCLMDMQMPIMGGVEATQIIRSQYNQQIPIIALTAAALKEDQDKAISSGMNDYLTKPIDFKKLKEQIYKWTIGRLES